MGKALSFSFVAMGVTSLVAQVVLVRELLVVFYGNEFFIGWTLFSWLAWTAAGAGLGGRLLAGVRDPVRAVAAGHVGTALLLPAAIAFLRASRALTGTLPGAMPDLLPAMLHAFLAMAPLCAWLGAQFVLAARAGPHAGADSDPARALGRAYVLETAGFVAGGILFSYVLVSLDEFRVAAGLGGLNLLAAFALRARRPGPSRLFRGALLLAAAGLLVLFRFADRAQFSSAAWRYPDQVLLESRNSIYGNLAVTGIGSQINFHENGFFLGTADERMAGELLVHFPMLAHPDPQRVLLIGTGFTGALREILKHAPAAVDHVELDPLWTELASPRVAPDARAALDDPRVRTAYADARSFLRPPPGTPAALYDVVLVNLPGPATALLNRYYSLEFFRDVQARLAPGGLLALRLAFSPDYLGPELETLGASIDRTLRGVFPSVALLPEYEILYLASDGGRPPSAADMVARYEARGLANDFVIPPYVQYRLGTDRIQRVRAAFDANGSAEINRDGRPIACHYYFVHWLSTFRARAAAVAARAGETRWAGAAAVAALLAAVAAGTARRRHARRIATWGMGIGSFTLMGGELALLLAFQIFCGYLYYKIALILAALMLGMAVGAAWSVRCLVRASPRILAGLHATAAACAAGLAGFAILLGSASPAPSPMLEAAFLLGAAAIGAVAGAEFPVANRIHLAGAADPRRSGVVYAVDLLGSCLAALAVGLWALPVLGIAPTLGLLAALNAGVAGLCLRLSPRAAEYVHPGRGRPGSKQP